MGDTSITKIYKATCMSLIVLHVKLYGEKVQNNSENLLYRFLNVVLC